VNKRLLVLCVLSLAGALDVLSAPKPSTRVVSYNVANYNHTGRLTEQGYKTAYPKPEAQKQALRKVLCALEPDVVLLQEVGGAEYLEELLLDLGPHGRRYKAVFVVEASDRTRKLALLSTEEPRHVQAVTSLTFPHAGRRVPVRRGLLLATFRTSAGPLSLYTLHLKSRHSEDPADPLAAQQRKLEAEQVRDWVVERQRGHPEEAFLVAGDFNATKEERPVLAFLKRGRTPLMRLQDASDSQGARWTHHHAKTDVYSRIDHVLFSPLLEQWCTGRKASAFVFSGPEVDAASDHRPLVVDLPFSLLPSTPPESASGTTHARSTHGNSLQ
jgi:endonuclease/exonuclease/phosphatase family metal-dependent hydrolase